VGTVIVGNVKAADEPELNACPDHKPTNAAETSPISASRRPSLPLSGRTSSITGLYSGGIRVSRARYGVLILRAAATAMLVLLAFFGR
jgi:hypothetical protein